MTLSFTFAETESLHWVMGSEFFTSETAEETCLKVAMINIFACSDKPTEITPCSSSWLYRASESFNLLFWFYSPQLYVFTLVSRCSRQLFSAKKIWTSPTVNKLPSSQRADMVIDQLVNITRYFAQVLVSKNSLNISLIKNLAGTQTVARTFQIEV